MNSSNQLQDMIAILKEKTVSSEDAFYSVGEELILELVGGLLDDNNERKTEFLHKFIFLYRNADIMPKRIVFFEKMIKLADICCGDEEGREENLDKLSVELDYLSRKTSRESILPFKKSALVDNYVCDIQMNVDELFMQHNTKVNCIDYSRLDFIIKYLFIENYYGLNDDGARLYEKLQIERLKKMKGPEINGEEYVDISKKAFADLIESFEQNGLSTDSKIVCSDDLFLLDGSHRLVLCLYHNIEKVNVRVISECHITSQFTVDNLKEYGFTDEEIQRILEKTEEILLNHMHPISCILWPSVQSSYDEIEADINVNCCPVVSSNDYNYSDETFHRIIKGIYAIDDIADWKIDKKLQAMSLCSEKKIRVLELALFCPRFRLKSVNNHTISSSGEIIKKYIREKYRDRVANYIYDIVVHTADNYEQSDYMYLLFMPCINLREYLDLISKFKYVLVKHDVPYMTEDFPNTYPFSKDIDIICEESELKDFVSCTEEFLAKKEHPCDLRVVNAKNHILYRLELDGFLLFQIDVGVSIDGMKKSFIDNMLENRCKDNNYYLPRISDEVWIRINEYIKNPNKKHHLEYINAHRDELNADKGAQILENDNNLDVLLRINRPKIKYGLLYYGETDNLGDDILTYAAKRFLPSVDYYIDREYMDTFVPNNKEYVKVIMNGWFLHNKINFPPSPYLYPLFIGTHFAQDGILGNYEYLEGYSKKYLQKYQPIGGRDRQTAQTLNDMGIESFYSGCMTLTITPFEGVKKNNTVIFTDVSENVTNYVRNLLPPDKNVEFRTHAFTDEERLVKEWRLHEDRAIKILKEYQAADLVITSRLHCALPCVALGTPVVLLGKYDDDFYKRMIDLAEYCSICLGEEDLFSGEYDEYITSPHANERPYELIADLESKCYEFVMAPINQRCELPDVDLYKEYYIERTKYIKKAYDRLVDIVNYYAE